MDDWIVRRIERIAPPHASRHVFSLARLPGQPLPWPPQKAYLWVIASEPNMVRGVAASAAGFPAPGVILRP